MATHVTQINGVVGSKGADNLFASTNPPAEIYMVKLAPSTTAGTVLKRGTVLGKNSSSLYGPVDGSTITAASFVLADDTDIYDTAAAYIAGQVYRTGHFVEEALITARDGGGVDQTDIDNLRSVGILTSTGIGY